MREWRVDSEGYGGGWNAVGWWLYKHCAEKFLRTQANPVLTFRIKKES